jgi:hypothetical protein
VPAISLGVPVKWFAVPAIGFAVPAFVLNTGALSGGYARRTHPTNTVPVLPLPIKEG